MIVWVTGAPGSGKTTYAKTLGGTLLDGDEVRKWLTPDCGFSPEDRLKHARRVHQVATLISSAGGTAVVALVAHPPWTVHTLVWIDGPNRRHMWKNTTYEPPEHPDVVINTWEDK